MRARTHSVPNGVRGLTRVTRGINPRTNDPVNFTKRSAVPHATHRIAEIFWETKGVPTRKAPSNQTVGGDLVYVDNR